MSCIHYKFKSNLDYSTLTFDGLHITLGDLKKLIIQKQKLGKSPDFDLQVTNAQTKEVYKNDDELIPKNASVIVSRAPLGASSKALGTATEASSSPSQGEPTASMWGDELPRSLPINGSNELTTTAHNMSATVNLKHSGDPH